jgi:ATP-binding cassette subfamily B protein
MAGLLLQLECWIAAVVLLSPIPAVPLGRQLLDARRAPDGPPLVGAALDGLPALARVDRQLQQGDQGFRLGDYFVRRYAEVTEDACQKTRDLAVKRQLAATVWGAIPVIATAGTFLYVALLAVRGQVSLGSLAVYTQAAQQGQAAFQGILGGVQSIYENSL